MKVSFGKAFLSEKRFAISYLDGGYRRRALKDMGITLGCDKGSENNALFVRSCLVPKFVR